MNTNLNLDICIIDDHPLTLKGLAQIIASNKSYNITFQGHNGLELLEHLEKANTIPDVVILDINMPLMNGYDTMNILHEKYPNIKILVYSMYNNEYAVARMMGLGARGFITKDCEPEDLLAAIKNIYTHGYDISDTINKHLPNGIIYSKDIVKELNNKEVEFLTLCCADVTYTMIASQMQISDRLAEKIRSDLFKKLNVNSRVGLSMFAIYSGLFTEKS